MPERTYEQGYEDGRSDVMADWIGALDEVGLGYLPFTDAAEMASQILKDGGQRQDGADQPNGN